ncbi:fusion protein [Tanapox virus]|uniref:Fusion protein n=2 Tax=Tanapox virus TaxID=99000 RepID=A7XCP4_9POXV|nr:112L protein [Yaba-like disease virus]ABQ43587.1 fusion protein [Tanapox virus]ABQ43742.1 fusion protein [Tanapox virus]CAC21350.1 112L protein [Yaba-like disease virus]
MITLFLVLCYFILIFNIIIPSISEKLQYEYNAYLKYKRLNSKFICVDEKAFSYTFNLSGITANMAIDNNGVPIPCSKINNEKKYNHVSCNNIHDLKNVCSKAYLNLFFTT